jgi:glucose-6-phosphate 1-epimerase
MDIDTLNRRFGRPPAVTFANSPLGGPVVTLAIDGGHVMASLIGGQVLSWVAHGRERLWLSPSARLDTGKPVRGGVPVCWPWFGPHPVDAQKPAHGFVRTRIWEVAEVAGDAASPSVTLSYPTDDADLLIWPHECEARLTVTLCESAALELSLATENCGLVPMHVTAALHTYFRVTDIARARVEGLENRIFIDKLSAGARKVEPGAVRFVGEVDRIYLGDTDRIRLVDEAAGAAIEITSAGSRSAVVWNPWSAKAARLGDMGAPGAYREMVCIETANAGDDIVTVLPGERHTLRASYRIG